MAKWEITIEVVRTITETRVFTLSAKDEDAAQEEAEYLAERMQQEAIKLKGKVEESEETIDSVEAVDVVEL